MQNTSRTHARGVLFYYKNLFVRIFGLPVLRAPHGGPYVGFPGAVDDKWAAAGWAPPAVEQQPGQQPQQRGAERVKGRQAFLDKLQHKLPGATPPEVDDPALGVPWQRVMAQVRALLTHGGLPGAGNGLQLCRWWHTEGARCFPDLLPGVRVLLSVPSGNAQLERCFGKASEHLTAKRKKNLLGQAMLGNNAAILHLPGYTHIAPYEENGHGGSLDDGS